MKHCELLSDLYLVDQAQESEQDHAVKASDAGGICSTHSVVDCPGAQAQAVDSIERLRHELKDVTVTDFTAFLCAFENSLQNIAVSLLRAATKLGGRNSLMIY
ncbi:hypothetical protein VTO73DRAFT_12104 [Trametes versicolor]